MLYNVKLETFEGPFDLLFHLIEKSKVDIYDIPIANIAQQYIDYIKNMKKFDLEVTSEFIIMAATLMEIKSKMLLPDKQEKQLAIDLEEDPRQELVSKLLEYKKYKQVALEFKERENSNKKIFYKQQAQLDQFVKYDKNNIIDIDMGILLNAFKKLLKKRKKVNESPVYVNEIKREEITIENRIEHIKKRLYEESSLEFEELFSQSFSKSEIVVTFLAILELMKLKFIKVQQTNVFGRIFLNRLV
ncbi:segregation/condensation protein A [Lutibacter sp. B2]|nr:segregation/condensation protein A [Lutibacter sp. B2]